MPLLYLAVGILIGVVIWWLVGLGRARPQPADARLEAELRQQLASRDSELIQLRSQFSVVTEARATADARRVAADQALADSRQANEQAMAQLFAVREQLSGTHQDLATAEATLAAAQKSLAENRAAYEKTLSETKAAHERALLDLREAFKALSADALKQTHPEFLRLATETLGKFQESAKGDLSQRQQAIATLVEPLKQQLDVYQKRLAQSETTQSTALGEVTKHLETLAKQSLSLSTETLQLRRVLSSNQARGKWGEETLRRVVEAAGMSPHCDFSEQIMSGDSKPDLVVHLPGDRLIIVDAKVPDLEFLTAIDGSDETKRAEALIAHARKLRETIKELGERDYPRQFSNALDYVVLFLPAESLFSAALEADRDLIIWAESKKIMLATPTSLIALLRAISMSWQQQAQSVNAREISESAQELFERVCKLMQHFESIRSGLMAANRAYDAAIGSYERMVRPSGERLVKLGGGLPGEELAEIKPLEASLRLPPVAQEEKNFKLTG